MTASRKASTLEILAIREEWDAGTISTRAWADSIGCSVETIRRIGRRDTCRDVHAGQSIEGQHPQAARASPLVSEPAPEEVASSLQRLQQSLNEQPASAADVDDALAELVERGKEST